MRAREGEEGGAGEAPAAAHGEIIDRIRAGAGNPQTLDARHAYTAYDQLHKKFPALDDIFNTDETGVEIDLLLNKVVGATGSKSAYHRGQKSSRQQHVIIGIFWDNTTRLGEL